MINQKKLEMEELEGSHGTSSHRAKLIEKKGFIASTGRGGTGIYFWRKSDYYRDLAVAWFKQQESEGTFLKEPKSLCAVIYVRMHVDSDQIIDLEDAEVKDEIDALSREKGIDMSDPREIASLYDYYVSEVENELGKRIVVTVARVAPPKNCPEYPIIMLGAPLCFIVRDKNVPRILKIETLPN